MKFPSNKTLAKIAVYGGFTAISAVMYMRYKIEDRVRNTEYYRQALAELRKHKGAVSLLGEPIKEAGFDLSSKTNYCDANAAHFEVKIKGPKDRGQLFFWANNTEEGWRIYRLELEVKLYPDKRFLIKKESES